MKTKILAGLFYITCISINPVAAAADDRVVQALDARALAGKIHKEFDDNKDLLGISEGKDVVVFLGNTGAGKSTLINYLLGHHLISMDEETYILRDSAQADTFAMGAKGSVTRYPQVGETNNGFLLCDLPGFRDKEGTVRNLTNAAFIHDILSKARSLRIIYVSKRDTFYADGRTGIVDQGVDAVRKLFLDKPNVLEDHGMFVLTASQKSEPFDAVQALLEQLEPTDPLAIVLSKWHENRQFHHMQSPSKSGATKEKSIQEVGARTNESILNALADLLSFKADSINIDALYPSEDHVKLQEMFKVCMEDAWNKFKEHQDFLTPLADLNRQTAADGFWDDFMRKIGSTPGDAHIGMVRRFAATAYMSASQDFINLKENERLAFLELLNNERKARSQKLQTIVQNWMGNWIADSGLESVFIGPFAMQGLASDFSVFLGKYADSTEQKFMRGYLDVCFHNHSLRFVESQMNPIQQRLDDVLRRLCLIEDNLFSPTATMMNP